MTELDKKNQQLTLALQHIGSLLGEDHFS